MIKITIGYPDKVSEGQVLALYKNRKPLEELEPVATAEDIIALQKICKEVTVAEEINQYIVNIAEVTRTSALLNLGMSTRAALSLQRIAQASALICGRNYVIPEDVKNNVLLVLAHRLTLSSAARANNYTSEKVIANLLQQVPVPKVN